MSLAKLTILGLEQWMQHDNKSIFDGMNLPSGTDKSVAVNRILFDCGEFESLYSNPLVLQTAIETWSESKKWSWQRKWDAINMAYDPLSNYDRKEEWHGSNSRTNITSDTSSGTGNATNNSFVSAYNTNVMQDDTKSVGNSSSTQTLQHSETDNSSNDRGGRTYGNIGVTTSQQMLKQELDVAKYDFYKDMSDSFKRMFCILVYE